MASGDKGPFYGALMGATLIATAAGLLTLMPASGVSYPNVLGYRSLCPFAPAASLYCFALAGTCCVVRASSRRRRLGLPGMRRGAVAVVGTLYLAAVGATWWYGSIKARYTDANTGATMSQQFEVRPEPEFARRAR